MNEQLAALGWSYNELARRADLSSASISHVMTQRRNPGFDFCVGVARAFGEQPVKILRLAGLLPPIPPAQQHEDEIRDLIRSLPPDRAESALLMLRGLSNETGRRDSGARLPAPNPTTLEGTMDSRLIGDAILKMDDPLRICYETLVDLMSPEQMTEFVRRLADKAAAIEASADRNADVHIRELANEAGDVRPVPALPGRDQVAEMPDEE